MNMHTTSLTPSTQTPVPGPGAEALVDLGAIAHNVRVLREHAGSAQVMAVVKADALRPRRDPGGRAALAAGAAELGVATIDEALALRDDGITAPVLAWLHPPGTDFAPGPGGRRPGRGVLGAPDRRTARRGRPHRAHGRRSPSRSTPG